MFQNNGGKENWNAHKMFKDRYRRRIELGRIQRFLQTTWSEETIDHNIYPTTKWSGQTQKLHCNELGKSYAEKKVPKNFWPEAVKWMIHILNRHPLLQ